MCIRDRNVPYRRTGSLVLAFSDAECRTLEELYRRGVANGVPDVALLSGEGVRALEPELSEQVKGALYAPTAAVVNPWEYALAMAEVALKNGVELYLEHPEMCIRDSLHCRKRRGWSRKNTRSDRSRRSPSRLREYPWQSEQAGLQARPPL